MALTESNNFKIGTLAPNFELINTIDHKLVKLSEAKGTNGTAIFFICNHCPFVIHINEELVKIANDYKNKGINCIAISSNDIEKYPQDGPELMKEHAEKLSYPFPYLFDKDLKAVYHGQLDDSRPRNDKTVTGKDFRSAINLLLKDNSIAENQKPSIGCNIKWK